MEISQVVTTSVVSLSLLTMIVVLLNYYSVNVIANPMTPYSIAKGKKWSVYNYRKHLTRKIKNGNYYARFHAMSDEWNTCPCGNLPQCIIRNVEGEPEDSILLSLGVDFSEKAALLKDKNDVELIMAQEELLSILRQIELKGVVLAGQEIAKQNQLSMIRIYKRKHVKVTNDQYQRNT